MNRHPLKNKILAVLEDHVGQENAISAASLYVAVYDDAIIPTEKVNKTRQLRDIITEIRFNKQAAILSGRNGYWLAADEEEINAYYDKRYESAKKKLVLVKREVEGSLAALKNQQSIINN